MNHTILTEDTLKLLYQTFCKMEPFKNLAMPYAYNLTFKVSRRMDIMGEFDPEDMRIEISAARNSHFETICKTLMHEMVHLHCYKLKHDNYHDHNNKTFKAIIKHIALLYGFDPKEL